MRNIELSLLVKTFVRPICLENFLKSVDDYQNYWDLEFKDIVIIDDSDEENKNINQQIVEKYTNLKINYKQYDFNSLGLSKGRNVGLEFINTDYFLLCDDDFIFDINCSLENNLKLAKEKNLDILSGYYKNIKCINSEKYNVNNWVGFIQENEEFDTCTIYSDILPEFAYCDIAQNFFIGKTESVKRASFPEDLPLLEHNIFFLRCKQNGLQVATTSRLYVRHLHLKNLNFDYDKYRNRTVVNPITKPVNGTLITDDCIYKFSDYLNVASEKFDNVNKDKKYTFKINLGICKISIYASLYKAIDKLLKKNRGFLNKFLLKYWIKRIKLNHIKNHYPLVMSTTETLDKIINEKKSIARFGDGELKLVLGMGLGEKDTFTEYQIFDSQLSNKLNFILKNPIENCLIGIDAFTDKYNDMSNYKKGLSYWEVFWLTYWKDLKDKYTKDYKYAITTFSRNTGFIENDLKTFKKIWNNRKVLFVVGEDSHWVEEKRLFDNIKTSEYLITKGRSTFSEYEKLLSKIKEYEKDWLVSLAIGPTSTVLAYELSKEGYQALDIGHMPNCYLQAIGERESPEKEHFKNKQFRKVFN